MWSLAGCTTLRTAEPLVKGGIPTGDADYIGKGWVEVSGRIASLGCSIALDGLEVSLEAERSGMVKAKLPPTGKPDKAIRCESMPYSFARDAR